MTDTNIRAQIEALDAQIAAEEQRVDKSLPINQAIQGQERVISLKLEKQRLLALEYQSQPADLKDQLQSLDDQISAVEKQVQELNNGVVTGINTERYYARLTQLKLEKQALLSRRVL
jgi:chromosome segregation ATPase